MKRICFDIGCNHYRHLSDGFLNNPSQARDEFHDATIKFYAATTFNSASNKFKDFTDPKKLLDYLVKADEIISFNGRTWDLIVLDKCCGAEAMGAIWRKPHHDLRGWKGFSLVKALREFWPDITASFDDERADRLEKIRKCYDDQLIADHLANTYRDVKFTFALFRRYMASGDSEYTFHDDSMNAY